MLIGHWLDTVRKNGVFQTMLELTLNKIHRVIDLIAGATLIRTTGYQWIKKNWNYGKI